jgi:hypothetical protein
MIIGVNNITDDNGLVPHRAAAIGFWDLVVGGREEANIHYTR